MSTRHHTKKVSKSEMRIRIKLDEIKKHMEINKIVMNAISVTKSFPECSNYILKRLNLL